MNIEQTINELEAKQILFCTEMIKAIREDRKTETRRIVKFPKDWDEKTVYDNSPYGCKYGVIDDIDNELLFRYSYKLLIKNDYLWIRETWQHTEYLNINPEDENYGYVYKASEDGLLFQENIEHWTWKPSIYMPKEACRLIIKIESIGVERLQDITEENAWNEGCPEYSIPNGYPNSIAWFHNLWIEINGQESWDKNIWVWVIKFSKHIQL